MELFKSELQTPVTSVSGTTNDKQDAMMKQHQGIGSVAKSQPPFSNFHFEGDLRKMFSLS